MQPMSSFSKFVKLCVCVCVCGGGGGGGGGDSKVVSYKYEGAEHLMLLHFTTQETFFNTKSGSVDDAWKEKRTCIVLDSGIAVIHMHLSIMFGV